MPFFVELPRDKYGNVGFTVWFATEKASKIPVIEAEVGYDERWELETLEVIWPSVAAFGWRSLSKDEFVEVEGPRRYLNSLEYLKILEEAGVSIE